MDNIPNRLECSYCIRHYTHGGECQGKKNSNDEKGCLIFKVDEKGCIRNDDFKLPILLYREIPFINKWDDGWQINGVSTEIRINKIYGLTWNTKTGNLIVHCNCDYYINEFHENYTETKPTLKIIK